MFATNWLKSLENEKYQQRLVRQIQVNRHSIYLIGQDATLTISEITENDLRELSRQINEILSKEEERKIKIGTAPQD